jgi:hypothetical protein
MSRGTGAFDITGHGDRRNSKYYYFNAGISIIIIKTLLSKRGLYNPSTIMVNKYI